MKPDKLIPDLHRRVKGQEYYWKKKSKEKELAFPAIRAAVNLQTSKQCGIDTNIRKTSNRKQ